MRRDGGAGGHVLDEDGARAAVLRVRLFQVEAPLVESSFGRHAGCLVFLFASIPRKLYGMDELQKLESLARKDECQCWSTPLPRALYILERLSRWIQTPLGDMARTIPVARQHLIFGRLSNPK